jgi:hypothetical protein
LFGLERRIIVLDGLKNGELWLGLKYCARELLATTEGKPEISSFDSHCYN